MSSSNIGATIAGGSNASQVDVPLPSNSLPQADNHVDAAIRTALFGSSLAYARADHKHNIRRQSNPGDPVMITGGSGITLNSQVVLDRWSDEETYAYHIRCILTSTAGTSWQYVTAPSKAGFQPPRISGISSYRSNSNTPQSDDPTGAGGAGASPLGPYMGCEWAHWSSSQQIYNGHYRREVAYTTHLMFSLIYTRI